MTFRQHGVFIVLEGTDGSGKATQTQLLAKRLEGSGRSVVPIDFPQYGAPSAGPSELYLNGSYGSADAVAPMQAALLYSVDHFDGGKKITTALEAGKTVIANRYMGSNLAHQGGKITDPAERQAFYAWLMDLEFTMLGIPRPDRTLVLHVAPDVGQRLVDEKGEREYLGGSKRDIHEADLSHLEAAERAYIELCDLYDDFILLECMENGTLRSREAIHEMIWQEVLPLL